MHLMLCLSTLSTLVFVALTQHLIQSTMRCENCIDSVDIDSIECIRDPCLVSTVSKYIVLMVWLRSPESQLSKTFCRLKIHWILRKLWAGSEPHLGWNGAYFKLSGSPRALPVFLYFLHLYLSIRIAFVIVVFGQITCGCSSSKTLVFS